MRILEYLKYKLNEILNDTRGECNIDFAQNFTPEQSATLISLGRIDDKKPIDFKEYATLTLKGAVPVRILPQRITLSKKIGKTVYDVTATFDIDSKRSIFQQFKELILTQKSVSHI